MSAFFHSEAGWEEAAPPVRYSGGAGAASGIDCLRAPRKHVPLSSSYDVLPLPHDPAPVCLRSHSTDVEAEFMEEQQRYILNRLKEIQFQRQISQAEEAFEEAHHQQQNEASVREQQRIAYWQQRSEELRLTLPTDTDDEHDQDVSQLHTAGSTRVPSTASLSRTLTDVLGSETGEEKSTNTACRTLAIAEFQPNNDLEHLPNHAILSSLVNMNNMSATAPHGQTAWAGPVQCVPVRVSVPQSQPGTAVRGPVNNPIGCQPQNQRPATCQPHQLAQPVKSSVHSPPAELGSHQQCEAIPAAPCCAASSDPSSSSAVSSAPVTRSLKDSCVAQHLRSSIQQSLCLLHERCGVLSREVRRLHNDKQMLKESAAQKFETLQAKIAFLKAENLTLRRKQVTKSMEDARKQCVHVA